MNRHTSFPTSLARCCAVSTCARRFVLCVIMLIPLLSLDTFLPYTVASAAASFFGAHAQRHEVFTERIQSLTVVADDDWMGMPVGHKFDIDFDDLTHEYHRYAYRIEHCEADWSVTQSLFPGDYVSGFSEGSTIDDVQESLNTNTLYTHYHLQIPNDRCRLKLSGNYKITIYDDNSGEDIIAACIAIPERTAQVGMRMTTNTDIDINKSHQQLEMEVRYNGLRVTNPESQIKTVVLQNGRWDNAVWNAPPTYRLGDRLQWQHCRQLIFPAGNEYRKFEMLDPGHATMGMDDITWDGTDYHAYLTEDEPRPSYIFDEDANGAFLIRNWDGANADTESEYVYTHFCLKIPRQPAPVYLNGAWTRGLFTDRYRMEWNEEKSLYEGVILLKLGYYNYQYLTLDAEGHTVPLEDEGSFFQTENSYQALVYYRGVGDRTDRLVGYAQIRK